MNLEQGWFWRGTTGVLATPHVTKNHAHEILMWRLGFDSLSQVLLRTLGTVQSKHVYVHSRFLEEPAV